LAPYLLQSPPSFLPAVKDVRNESFLGLIVISKGKLDGNENTTPTT